MPARVALNLRESGAVFPCKWCSVAEIYTCVRSTVSSMMQLCFRLRARASAAAVLRRFPCGRPQRLRPPPPAKRAAFKTYIQTGAGYTLPARIGDFCPAEIGCFLPAQNGDFLPALTSAPGICQNKSKKESLLPKLTPCYDYNYEEVYYGKHISRLLRGLYRHFRI